VATQALAALARARILIGADGMRSLVARAVAAPRRRERPTLAAAYYAYWSDLPVDGLDGYIRPNRAFAAAPTHDDLTMVVVNWPRGEFDEHRKHIEAAFLSTVALVPEFADRMARATRETRFVGTGDLPNFFRASHGPGWALVGDAGYHKDPITAQGITDAFRDAEATAAAVDDGLAGRLPITEALARRERARDAAALPMYEFTCDLASLQPPPPEQQELLAATQGNPDAMDDFVSVVAGTVPVAEFFAPDNVTRIVAEATAAVRS
jgi:2-polyprenyl-6-methoxyphenol hydroxylase-like FAD-dependent oxidoreductase